MHRHVLVVLAHPDDEAFGCSGTIALHSRAGTPVTYACATLGEMGRHLGNPPFATRESLPSLREQELREVCDILGIQDLRLLGLRDKTIEFIDPDLLRDRIRTIIDELNPSLVITFYPGYAVHPDHDSIGLATVRAVESMPAERRPLVHCLAFSANIADLGPFEVVDISEVRDLKIAAVQAHRSQSGLANMLIGALASDDRKARATAEERLLRERFWVFK